jgi:hypothetical protein
VILLDTHIWLWWVHGDSRLNSSHAKLIEDHEDKEIGVCTIELCSESNDRESATQLCAVIRRLLDYDSEIQA